MRMVYPLLFLAGTLCFPLNAMAQKTDTTAPDNTQVSLSDRAFIASKMYASIGLYFAHLQGVPGFELDAAYKTYLEEALNAPGRYEFDMASMAFVAQLHNGHSDFSDSWLWENYGKSFGFRAQFIEEKWVVVRSVRKEVKVGDVIQAIDETPMEAFFQKQKKYIGASNERAARTNLFARRFLFPQQFSLTLADGRKFPIDRITPPASPAVKTEGKWLKENVVAYIKIPGFGEPQYEKDALKFVKDYQNAPTLIIDVRGNGGGSTPGELIEALMDRPYRQQSQASPLGVAVFKVRGGFFQQMQKETPPDKRDETYGYMEAMGELSDNAQILFPAAVQIPKATLFKNRLILLIDRNVASAAEDFSMPFKDNHRATILGEATFGSTGQPFFMTFPNGSSFRVSAKRDSFPDGSPFEGVGIVPDIEIPATLAALQSGKDPVLEKAMEVAKQHLPTTAIPK